MAVTTTYTCDRCGHEQNTSDQMWSIGVYYQSGQWLNPSGSSFGDHKRLWCRSCMTALGLLGAADPPCHGQRPEPTPDPKPTIEDMIREIVRNEIGG